MRTSNDEVRMTGRVLALLACLALASISSGCANRVDTAETTSISSGGDLSSALPSDRVNAAYGAGRETVSTGKVVATAYLGSAPYICTPSGFGRTSTCFLR